MTLKVLYKKFYGLSANKRFIKIFLMREGKKKAVKIDRRPPKHDTAAKKQ